MSNYTPQKGSPAFRAIEFFVTHPDAELTCEQLESRFEKPAKQWHLILSAAVSAGALKRFANEDEDIVYTLGQGTPNIKPNQARHPTLRPDTLLAGAQLGKKRASRPAHTLDLATLALRSGVPLAVAKTARSTWPVLLERMRVGQSCVLPRAVKGGLGAAISKAKKAGTGEFALRKLGDGEIGLWRVA